MQQTAPSALCAYPAAATRSTRAPAIYCRLSGVDQPPATFRLPCPPTWNDRKPAAWAAERRARRAYFAALDALRTGEAPEVERAKLQRFLQEVRVPDVRERLEHLLRVLDFAIGRAGRGVPLPERPVRPYTRLELTVPASRDACRPEQLSARFQWALEWLRTRGYVAGRDLRIDWRVQLRPATRDSNGRSPKPQQQAASA